MIRQRLNSEQQNDLLPKLFNFVNQSITQYEAGRQGFVGVATHGGNVARPMMQELNSPMIQPREQQQNNPYVFPADLFVPSPGYKVLPDLATVPPPFSMRSLHSRCPQCQFECSKWCCQHRNIKHIIFSCHNDVMNPYKRSCPDRDAVLWLPTANWTVSCVCPTVCSPIPMALAFSIKVIITVAPRSNWESKPEQEPQPCWCGEPGPPK